MQLKVGDRGKVRHCGYIIGVAGKPETEIYTIIKIGRKNITVRTLDGKTTSTIPIVPRDDHPLTFEKIVK